MINFKSILYLLINSLKLTNIPNNIFFIIIYTLHYNEVLKKMDYISLLFVNLIFDLFQNYINQPILVAILVT